VGYAGWHRLPAFAEEIRAKGKGLAWAKGFDRLPGCGCSI